MISNFGDFSPWQRICNRFFIENIFGKMAKTFHPINHFLYGLPHLQVPASLQRYVGTVVTFQVQHSGAKYLFYLFISAIYGKNLGFHQNLYFSLRRNFF